MNFVEQYIFEKLKDKSFRNIGVFKNVINNVEIDISKVYRNIVNYQIKKYGSTLCRSNEIEYPNFEKLNQIVRSRKYQKRNYERRIK